MGERPRPAGIGGWVVARPFGIELAVHPSRLATFALLGVVARGELAPQLAPRAGAVVLWGIAAAMALGFAASVVLHEMSHAVVARAHGLEAKRITLFLFGGVASIGNVAPSPAAEFRIAIAGPLSSLIIAGSLAATSRLAHPGDAEALPGVWGFFAAVNLVVALFNLVPGYPLDGGRILRSGLWMATRDRAKATRWAAVGGRLVALGLMGAGVYAFGRREDGGILAGAWYLLLGWFLYGAVGAAAAAETPRPEGSRPPGAAATVASDEGPATKPYARGAGGRAAQGPRPPDAPPDQPGHRAGHPRRRPRDPRGATRGRR